MYALSEMVKCMINFFAASLTFCKAIGAWVFVPEAIPFPQVAHLPSKDTGKRGTDKPTLHGSLRQPSGEEVDVINVSAEEKEEIMQLDGIDMNSERIWWNRKNIWIYSCRTEY